ncbi:MAG: FmdE family protein [Nitrospiraceae bacterium]|nr:FmdE family protein [Nitrospiraceae bacterium]
MPDLERLLQESAKVHGHLCAGQVLGVRMSMLGLNAIGISDPKGKDRKDFIVFVEIDRCATDAIQSVTGCTLGKRTLKFVDYGKMAATFVNLKTGVAVRVLAREDSRQKAKEYFPEIADRYEAQLKAYKIMPDAELFETSRVRVDIKPEDMPGRPLGRVRCEACGEYVQDRREIMRDGRILCRPCANGGYYKDEDAAAFFSPSVMQFLHNDFGIRSKLWIELEGEPVFGRGRMFLLAAIDRWGSINRAAREAGISYRKAWSYIKAMEDRLGIRLVERRSGGKGGGGAELTPGIRDFLSRYEAIEKDIRKAADERFNELFGQ